MSPFQLVYGTNVVFPSSFWNSSYKVVVGSRSIPNDMYSGINQMIQLQQTKQEVYKNPQAIQDIIKKILYKGKTVEDFQDSHLLLKWDARNEGKGKHGNF